MRHMLAVLLVFTFASSSSAWDNGGYVPYESTPAKSGKTTFSPGGTTCRHCHDETTNCEGYEWESKPVYKSSWHHEGYWQYSLPQDYPGWYRVKDCIRRASFSLASTAEFNNLINCLYNNTPEGELERFYRDWAQGQVQNPITEFHIKKAIESALNALEMPNGTMLLRFLDGVLGPLNMALCVNNYDTCSHFACTQTGASWKSISGHWKTVYLYNTNQNGDIIEAAIVTESNFHSIPKYNK